MDKREEGIKDHALRNFWYGGAIHEDCEYNQSRTW
jgi:hypothetical protein